MGNGQLSYTSIDHFVLAVDDIDQSCPFCEDTGGEIRTFGDNRKAVQFDDQKINFPGRITPQMQRIRKQGVVTFA